MAQASELLDELIGHLFHVTRTVGRAGGEGLGIDKASLFVLISLKEAGPSRPSVCAHALALDQSTVSRHLKNLEALGAVEREPDPEDGRAQLFRLTAEGVAILERQRVASRTRLDHALEDWDDEDRAALNQLLARLAAGLSRGPSPIRSERETV